MSVLEDARDLFVSSDSIDVETEKRITELIEQISRDMLEKNPSKVDELTDQIQKDIRKMKGLDPEWKPEIRLRTEEEK